LAGCAEPRTSGKHLAGMRRHRGEAGGLSLAEKDL
jgi:hypothetical protein